MSDHFVERLRPMMVFRHRLVGVCIDRVRRKSGVFPADFVARIAAAFKIEPVVSKETAA